MSIISASKIFTDQNEELTFIIERVRNADKDKVALIIPENALVFSSPVSIKILQRMMYKADKSPIIITEDSYGQKFAQKIGLIVVGKTSQITEELWDIAFKRKVKYNNQMRDPEAAAERNAEETLLNDSNEEIAAVNEVEQDLVENESLVPQDKIESIIRDNKKEDESVEVQLESAKDEDIEDSSIYRKQREAPKVITVGGISVFSGGDAKLLKSQFKNVKIEDDTNLDMERTFEPTGASNRFTGKDFTKAISPENKLSNFFSKLFNRNKRRDLNTPGTPVDKRKARILIAIISICSLTALYFLLFQFSSVDIRIDIIKQDVSATSQVLLNPSVTEIGTQDNKVVIPGKILTIENFSASWTGEANGVGRTGTKAGGVVNLYNSTPEAVTIPAGTKILNKQTGRSYVITEQVALPGETGTGIIDPGEKENVPMEAVDFGTEYNIDAAVTQNYSVDGFDDDDIFARSFDRITGGSVEEFIMVSEENVNGLKKLKEAEFKAQAETRLKSQIPGGSFLVVQTIQIVETATTSVPKIGERSLDNTFALTLEANITGYLISNSDLKELGERLISESQTSSVVNALETPQITSVTKGETDIYTLDVTTQGSVGERIDPEEVKKEIAGGNIDNARKYIQGLSGVQNFSVRFNPGFVPEFLQFVPASYDRISVRLN